jgi:hypothetical protein
MNLHKTFKPAICGFDQFDQAVELRRLGEFADQVSTEQVREYINNNLDCVDQAARDRVHAKRMRYIIGSTIIRLIELDLLRYGNVVGQGSRKQKFGAVRQSKGALDFILSVVFPQDYITGCLVVLLAHGCVSVEIDEDCGEPDFVFGTVRGRLKTVEHLMASVPTEHDLETIAHKDPERFPNGDSGGKSNR